MISRSAPAMVLMFMIVLSAGCIQQEMDLTDEAQLQDRPTETRSRTSVPTATATDRPNTSRTVVTAPPPAGPDAAGASLPSATIVPTTTPSRTPTVSPTPTSTIVPSPTTRPTGTSTHVAQATAIPTLTSTLRNPAPVTGNSSVPINYFEANADWDALVSCVASFGPEFFISPDEFRNVAGPFGHYESGLVFFQGSDEAVALNSQSAAAIRYVTQGDPLFRYEPPHFGQLPWNAETVIGGLQPGDWIIVGGQSGYLGVACNAYEP